MALAAPSERDIPRNPMANTFAKQVTARPAVNANMAPEIANMILMGVEATNVERRIVCSVSHQLASLHALRLRGRGRGRCRRAASRCGRASDGGGQAAHNAPTRPMAAVGRALTVPIRPSSEGRQSEHPFANPRKSDPP